MRMRLFLLVAIAACVSESSTTKRPLNGDEAPAGEHASIASSCPMMVQGTTISLRDAQGGVALVFTTDTGDVDDLRARVDRMGEVHHRSNMMPMADAQVRVEDVEDGAQLVFIPADASQLEIMRLHLQKAAATMESGECPTAEVATRTE